MKTARVRFSFLVPGVIVLILGMLWILQGVGLVGGSFMTGQSRWLFTGIAVAIVGLWFIYRGLTARSKKDWTKR